MMRMPPSEDTGDRLDPIVSYITHLPEQIRKQMKDQGENFQYHNLLLLQEMADIIRPFQVQIMMTGVFLNSDEEVRLSNAMQNCQNVLHKTYGDDHRQINTFIKELESLIEDIDLRRFEWDLRTGLAALQPRIKDYLAQQNDRSLAAFQEVINPMQNLIKEIQKELAPYIGSLHFNRVENSIKDIKRDLENEYGSHPPEIVKETIRTLQEFNALFEKPDESLKIVLPDTPTFTPTFRSSKSSEIDNIVSYISRLPKQIKEQISDQKENFQTENVINAINQTMKRAHKNIIEHGNQLNPAEIEKLSEAVATFQTELQKTYSTRSNPMNKIVNCMRAAYQDITGSPLLTLPPAPPPRKPYK